MKLSKKELQIIRLALIDLLNAQEQIAIVYKVQKNKRQQLKYERDSKKTAELLEKVFNEWAMK